MVFVIDFSPIKPVGIVVAVAIETSKVIAVVAAVESVVVAVVAELMISVVEKN